MNFRVKTYYKFSNNEYRPALIDTSVDICAAQSGLYSSPLFNVFKNVVGNTTNFLDHNCPYPPGTYYVIDMRPDATMFPSVVITMKKTYYIMII